MMKVNEIKTVQDAQTYLEGVLNDFEAGIATKSETMKYLAEYTAKVFELSRVKKPHDVVGRSEQLLAFKKWEAKKCKLPWDVSPEQIIKQYLSQ